MSDKESPSLSTRDIPDTGMHFPDLKEASDIFCLYHLPYFLS